MSRLPWIWLAAFPPFLLGVALFLLFSSGLWSNPVAFVRAPISTWCILFGLAGSLAVAFGLAVYQWARGFQHRVERQTLDDRRRFLSRLDHELKNPLTAIRAGLANLTESASPNDRRLALSSVDAQALRLSRLLADLRKLADLEARPLERTQVDLSELLAEVVALGQDRPGAEQRRLVLSIPRAPWPLPHVPGDRDLLFLAFHNLVDNALKFTRPGDTVEVRAFEDGAAVAVEVADTGPGIPPDELPHVWEELYRGRQARGVPGSGLGLALVRAIAERHGGRVTLRSRLGQGTVFSLRLPAG